MQKVTPDLVAYNLTVFCKHCRKEFKVNIVECQCYNASASD